MAKTHLFEKALYLGISSLLNLIVFTLLSMYLFVSVNLIQPHKPLQVMLEESPKHKEVEFSRGRAETVQKTKTGEGFIKRGKDVVSSSPANVKIRAGDVQVPAGVPEDGPSLLEEIERKIRGKEKQAEEGLKGKNLGDITAVVSSGGVGISGSGRATLYVPPFPKLVSDEPLSPIRVRVWVEPSGIVSRVEVLQKSGSPQVDAKILDFVKRIRFEPIREDVVQTGVITFRFRGG